MSILMIPGTIVEIPGRGRYRLLPPLPGQHPESIIVDGSHWCRDGRYVSVPPGRWECIERAPAPRVVRT